MSTPEEQDRRVRQATPWSQEWVAALPLDGAQNDLLEEIMALPVLDRPVTPTPPRRTPRWVVPVAAAAAVVLAVGVPVWVGRGGAASPPTYASSATAVAEDNPRLLVRAPGWQVSRVDEFTAAEGEMTFTDGTHELDVHWRDAGSYHGYLDDRSHDMTARPVRVLGREGRMFGYGGGDFTTLLPPDGPTFLEIRGDLGTRVAYVDLLGTLTPVGVDDWLAAMPDNVVTPSDVDAVVATMLRGVPLPPGFDAAPLSQDLAKERYQVGADVAGAVACAWLDRWADARADQDAVKAEEATAALETSHHWKVLLDMDAEGDYPEVLWEIADAAAGHGDPDLFDGPPSRAVWTQGLGCDTAPRDANLTR